VEFGVKKTTIPMIITDGKEIESRVFQQAIVKLKDSDIEML